MLSRSSSSSLCIRSGQVASGRPPVVVSIVVANVVVVVRPFVLMVMFVGSPCERTAKSPDPDGGHLTRVLNRCLLLLKLRVDS